VSYPNRSTALPVSPPGLFWLPDTLNGIDLYAGGFILRPTIYFDPTAAATSFGYGTFKHPYFTQAQLESVCRGDMSNETLGIKRGTTTRVTGAGLTMTTNGSNGRPFTVCPYGDAQALPIITGGAVELGWASVDAQLNIWSIAMATEVPCFQSLVRLVKVAYNTSPAVSLTAPGTATYQSGVLYIRPFDGADPRLGMMELAKAKTPFRVLLSDVAATGYVHVAGLDTMLGYECAAQIGSASTTNVASVADLMFTGCSGSHIGTDGLVVTGSGDAFQVFGATTTKRATAVIVQGCRAKDITNNVVEFSFTSGGKVLRNMGGDVSGNSIVELWSDNDNCTIQYNIGELSRNRYATNSALGGIWFANVKTVAGVESTDTANTVNTNNKASFNLIIAPQRRGFAASGGSGHSFTQNTVVLDDDRCNGLSYEGASYWFTEGNAATGFCNISNNLFYTKNSVNVRYPICGSLRAGIGAAKSNPIGQKNIYCPSGAGSYAWEAAAKSDYYFTLWQSSLATASIALDQNSLLYAPESNAPLKRAQLGYNEATNRPIKTMAPGLTTLSTIGSRYNDGQPYVTASATIGAFDGY